MSDIERGRIKRYYGAWTICHESRVNLSYPKRKLFLGVQVQEVNQWFIFRLIIIAISAADGIINNPRYNVHPDMDWQSCGIIFIATAIIGSIGFIALYKSRRSTIPLTKPSWFQNPFQFRSQPLQFLHLGAFTAIAVGTGAVFRILWTGRYEQMSEQCVPLAMGLAVWIALRILVLVCFQRNY